MGYRNLGYIVQPEIEYLPLWAGEVMRAAGPGKFDAALSDALECWGSRSSKLSELTLPRMNTINTDVFPAGEDLQRKLVILIAKFLAHAGLGGVDVPRIQYIEDPVLNIDQVTTLMCASRMPWMTSDEVGGTNARVDALIGPFSIFLVKLRDALRERDLHLRRLRTYLMHVGWKIYNNMEISQEERTFFIMYGSRKFGSPGSAATDKSVDPLPCEETAEPLVLEAFELYKKSTQKGPFWRYVRMISNALPDSLVFYIGRLPAEVRLSIGYNIPFSVYMMPKLETGELIKWSSDLQMSGIADTTSLLTRPVAALGDLTMSQPTMIYDPALIDKSIMMDSPDITILLADESSIEDYDLVYTSSWRQRNLSLKSGDFDITTYFVERALKAKEFGELNVEYLHLEGVTMVDMTDPSLKDRIISKANDTTVIDIWLPQAGSRTLEKRSVDITDLIARRANRQMRSAFSSQLIAPMKYFDVDEPAAVSFIAGRVSPALTIEEKYRYSRIISVAYRCAIYKMVTGNEAPFDVPNYLAAIGNFETT